MSLFVTAQSAGAHSHPEDSSSQTEPISVLVVDDSAFMRKMVSEMVAGDPALKLAGTARDGEDALEQIERFNPRVVTLDIEMPHLDGFGVLRALGDRPADKPPVSVVVVSSLTQAGADATLKCLNLGAVDFIAKPSGAISLDIDCVRDELLAKVKFTGHARSVGALAQRRKTSSSATIPPPPAPAPSRGAKGSTGRLAPSGRVDGVLVIGASTGGPRALQEIFASLCSERIGLPIVVVQHMPPRFTASLASHIQEIAGPGLGVYEARDGDTLQPGRALIAPGGKHLVFDSNGIARLTSEPPIHGVRPSVDVTMTSLAQLFKKRTFGVLLTGMGRDGARAMKLVRDMGGHTIAEDESSCVVYGMPKAAVELGAVESIVPLPKMAETIMQMVERAK